MFTPVYSGMKHSPGAIPAARSIIGASLTQIKNQQDKSCKGTIIGGGLCRKPRMIKSGYDGEYCSSHQPKPAKDTSVSADRAVDFEISVETVSEPPVDPRVEQRFRTLEAFFAQRVETLETDSEVKMQDLAKMDLRMRQCEHQIKLLSSENMALKMELAECKLKLDSSSSELERMGMDLASRSTDVIMGEAVTPPAFDLALMEQSMAELRIHMEELQVRVPKAGLESAVAELKASVAEIAAQPKTFASVVGKPNAGQEGLVPTRAASPLGGSTNPNLLRFSITGLTCDGKREDQLSELVKNTIMERMGVSVTLTEARLVHTKPGDTGSDRKILFSVLTPIEARAIVFHRRKLAKSGITIRDDLTKEELAQHKLMWPVYQQAKHDGKQAWFSRARLIVNGTFVAPPVSPTFAA